MAEDRRKYRVAAVSRVSGASTNSVNTWLKRGLLKLDVPDQSGWREYTFQDLLRVCAWAEVNRIGIAPNQAVGLTEAIEIALQELSDGQGDPKDGRFVIAEVWERLDQEKVRMRVTRNASRTWVVNYFRSPPPPSADITTVVIIDVLKLWRRVSDALSSLGEDEPR